MRALRPVAQRTGAASPLESIRRRPFFLTPPCRRPFSRAQVFYAHDEPYCSPRHRDAPKPKPAAAAARIRDHRSAAPQAENTEPRPCKPRAALAAHAAPYLSLSRALGAWLRRALAGVLGAGASSFSVIALVREFLGDAPPPPVPSPPAATSAPGGGCGERADDGPIAPIAGAAPAPAKLGTRRAAPSPPPPHGLACARSVSRSSSMCDLRMRELHIR